MNTQFSELMGSFIRTGDFPLEANYIFPNEESLKEFYSDELNVTTLHKGLLKIVENDGEGNQALFWVTKKSDSNELEFTKLISSNYESIFEELESLSDKLDQEITKRKETDESLWGTNKPKDIPDDLNSIIDLANAIQDLKKETKALAGTDEDNVVEYLKTLPYQSLTEVSKTLDTFINQYDELNENINTLPEIQSFLEGFTDKDNLKDILDEIISNSNILGTPIPSEDFRTLRGIEDFVRLFKSESEHTDANLQTELNQTQQGVGLDSDGKFSPDQETTHLKNATSVMNALKILDSVIDQYKYSFVESGYYDSEKEDIVLVLKLSDDTTKELRISAHSLVEELDIDNSSPTKVVELDKRRLINGSDKLSADVRLSTNKYNILEKDSNTLLVRGTADNIVFEGDLSVKEKIEQLDVENTIQQDLIDNLTSELVEEQNRAQLAEQELESKINERLKNSFPIVKEIISARELPANPQSGDAYLVKTDGAYYLHEWNGKNWNVRILNPGTLFCVIDGETYRITSTGLDHILDESDLTESNSTQFELTSDGTHYKLKSNLKIDTEINNSSDILLTISSKGLSATVIWGDYD